MSRRWLFFGSLVFVAGLWGSGVVRCDPAPSPDHPPVELAKPFDTRSPWRLVVKEGPAAVDYGENPAPGLLSLCLEKGPAAPCVSDPVWPITPKDGNTFDLYGPHYLKIAKPVYPQGPAAAPLLLLVTASVRSGDGGQVIATQLLKYNRAQDTFERIYLYRVGTNNNDEVRFLDKGPLRGSVISAEPTPDGPYGYWIAVNRLTPAGAYRQALRYRSSTRYNDGNSLAVIDSEMPNIERRLGVWRPGAPLPLPMNKPCPKPTLKHTELWCS